MHRIVAVWHIVEAWAHKHRKTVKHAHHGSHFAYLGMVAMHGPYHLAAMALLVISGFMWVFHITVEEV